MKLCLTLATILGLSSLPSFAAGPVETSSYAVQGIVMDEEDISAKVLALGFSVLQMFNACPCVIFPLGASFFLPQYRWCPAESLD